MNGRYESSCPFPQPRFWEATLSEAFNAHFFLDVEEFESWRRVSCEEQGDEVRIVSEGAPHVARVIPEDVRRYTRRGLSYRETLVLDRRMNHAQVTIVPRAMSRWLTLTMEITTAPEGVDRCRVTYETRVAARLAVSLGGTSSFGIGRMVEQEILDRFTSGCARRQSTLEAWVLGRRSG